MPIEKGRAKPVKRTGIAPGKAKKKKAKFINAKRPTSINSFVSSDHMNRYEKLGRIGEGSYGVVFKCRVKDTGQFVAIKKFSDSEEDRAIKKIAQREIAMLRKLRHDNLVNMIEVFRRRDRLHLVFEFCERSLLDDLVSFPTGISSLAMKKVMWQLLEAVSFCHKNNCIHRDIKPENILLTRLGVVKLCDFGFARMLTGPDADYTEYVATRWYRAPELLVGDTRYGSPVDIWAIGCVFAELMNGDALWPGRSDIDQLYCIQKTLGRLPEHMMRIFRCNSFFQGQNFPPVPNPKMRPFKHHFPRKVEVLIQFLESCLVLEPDGRLSCSELLMSNFFEGFSWFEAEVKRDIEKEKEEHAIFNLKKTTAGGDSLPGVASTTVASGGTLPQLHSDSKMMETSKPGEIPWNPAEPPPSTAPAAAKPPTKLPTIEQSSPGHYLTK